MSPFLRIDFEDTYDGLGDQLQEEDDDFNDDTFGGGTTTAKAPGKDFDFFGNTSKVSDAINEEAARFNRRPPASKPLAVSSAPKPGPKPFKTGYETYRDPANMTGLQVDPNLWGTAPTQPPASSQSAQPATSLATSSRKMMSLEEIEAQMFAPNKTAPYIPPPQQALAPAKDERPQAMQQQTIPFADPAIMHSMPQRQSHPPAYQTQQVPQKVQPQAPTPQPARHISRPSYGQPAEMPAQLSPALHAVPTQQSGPPQILQRRHESQQSISDPHPIPQPRQILQNPNRQPDQMGPMHTERVQQHQLAPPQARMVMPQYSTGSVALPIITHPSQLQDLSEKQREAFMIEDAKRAKRNHKIFLMSKNNGLMTPQDKNFITRIQLQQLMTATGNANEQDPDASLSEDFYYQVFNQIENRPRQNPHQPLSNFAQTYLFQTGSRQGALGRRNNRGGDSHVHRMQQQVQRAVEAAKAKPKGKQLVIEGSLGKISFSNAKTPKPLLNIKKQDNKLPHATLSSTDRKAILKNIEAVYNTLMKMEDHARHQPPPPPNGDEPSEALSEWRQAFQDLNQKLWFELKVLEPIMPESTVLHPFIAFLSYPKGKKAIPRIFSQIDHEQRLTILTIIMVQLDTLDVVRSALPQFSQHQSQSVAREQIDLFLQTVMPTLFAYVTEAPLNIVMGLLSLILDRVNVQAISHTRAGLEILTMFLSQAEIIRKTETTEDQEWQQWVNTYNRLFDVIEPILADIFPGPVSAGQDVYVWQFLATVGTGASPEQQQRLVLAVK